MLELKRLAPRNWFKNEEEQQQATLCARRSGQHMDYSPIAHFHREMDRRFEDFFRGFNFPSMGFGREFAPLVQREWLKPTLDIAASEKDYTISVEVPGVDEKDVQLELSDGTLVIKGEKKQAREQKEKNYYKMERSYGSFQRLLSLPEDTELDSIEAVYKHGMLTITIPRKAKAATKSQRIPIYKG